MSYDSPRPDAVAHNLILPAAEMGLLYRPIHLLVGHMPWGECLSPYTRDLTITLDQFAERKIATGSPLPLKPAEPGTMEDWRYGIAEHFLNEDEKRITEKQEVEAKLGIMRLDSQRPHCLWIDSKRLDWNAVDSRLSALSKELKSPEPVWLILAPQEFQDFSEVLQEVIAKLSTQLRSVTASSEYGLNILLKNVTTAQCYTLPGAQAGQAIHEQAIQSLGQTLGQTFQPPQGPSQPQKTNSGPLHRIKA